MPGNMQYCPCCLPPWTYSRPGPTFFTHLKLDSDRNVQWFANHGGGLEDIRVTGETLCIAGTANFFQSQVRKIAQSDGGLVWSLSELAGNSVGVSVANSGRIVTTPNDDHQSTLRVRDTNGTLLWSKTLYTGGLGGSEIYINAVIDSSDNVYASSSRITQRVRAFDADGNDLWSRARSTNAAVPQFFFDALAVNDVHVAHASATYGSFGQEPAIMVLEKTTGVFVWQYAGLDIGFRDVAFLSDGGLVSVGQRNDDSGDHLFRFSSTGTLLWSKRHGRTLNAVAVDSDDNIYVAGEVAWTTVGTGGPNTRCYDVDGNLLWSLDTTFGRTQNQSRFIPASMCVDSDGNIYQAGSQAFQPQWANFLD